LAFFAFLHIQTRFFTHLFDVEILGFDSKSCRFSTKSEPGLLLLGFLAFLYVVCAPFFFVGALLGPLCQYLFGLHERTNCEENVLEKVVDVF
jgi:hypothetical protein